jgi:hypothetical protein
MLLCWMLVAMLNVIITMSVVKLNVIILTVVA